MAAYKSHYSQDSHQDLYAHRYNASRKRIERPEPDLPHVLGNYKHKRPDHFRRALRVSPRTFDKLVEEIQDDPVFYNDSPNAQIPVEEQVAIALYRFGRSGNGASLEGVAEWAGVGKGTVLNCTRRVMTAVIRPSFMQKAVRLPTEEEKAAYKDWVEQRSGCKDWREGWAMVDGTLIPLFDRPFWYGASYFDRKCNYSMNIPVSPHSALSTLLMPMIQIVSTPDMKIIDFGYGFTGSTHDSTAWEKTYFAQNHAHILKPKEFIWADSAYPVSHVSERKACTKHGSDRPLACLSVQGTAQTQGREHLLQPEGLHDPCTLGTRYWQAEGTLSVAQGNACRHS
jgi:hypothetical protein